MVDIIIAILIAIVTGMLIAWEIAILVY